MRGEPHSADRPGREPVGTDQKGRETAEAGPAGRGPVGDVRGGEWAALGEWLDTQPQWHKVDLGVLREGLSFVGRARASLAALEADVVAEVARRQGDAATEEMLQRDQKRSRRGARKAVKVAGQLGWAPRVADKLADGAITPEAAALILDAAADTPVDQRKLLEAAEEQPEDQFRRTLKDHVNERTSEQELEERRASQRRRRRASISEQPDGMFHLFAQFDPLTGAQVQAALVAKADELFRNEDPKDRAAPPQRFADALAQMICTGDGAGVPAGVELIVLADYDAVHDKLRGARLADGTPLTEAEALATACDAKILPGIFNKHTGNVLLGRSQRKVSPRLRKRLIARDGGCVGCGAHHKICQVHHLDHWQHGGETSYENTCLLCWRCHHIRVHLHGERVTRHPGGRLSLGPPAGANAPTRPHELRGTAAGGPTTRHAPRREPPTVAGRVVRRPMPRGHGSGRAGEHRPTGSHRRGPPDTPEPTRPGLASVPFPDSDMATAPHAERRRASGTAGTTV